MSDLDDMLKNEVPDEDFDTHQAGIELYWGEDYAGAIRVLTELVARLPPLAGKTVEGDARKYIGFAYLKLGDTERGMREINFAKQLFDDEPCEVVRRGQLQELDFFLKDYFGVGPNNL